MDDDVVKESRESPADAQQIGYSLSDLDKEYVFFNHGALFAFAEFVNSSSFFTVSRTSFVKSAR